MVSGIIGLLLELKIGLHETWQHDILRSVSALAKVGGDPLGDLVILLSMLVV